MKRHPVYGGFPIAVDQLFVRCFSQKRLMPQSKASSEIVLDSQTRLMWTRKDNGKRLNWCEANQSAKELDLEGYRDWRLPSLKELHQLWDQHSPPLHRVVIHLPPHTSLSFLLMTQPHFQLAGGI